MIHGVKGTPVHERFVVTTKQGDPVTGINTSEFTAYLYAPDGTNVAGLMADYFNELGDGTYEYVFTPDENGYWFNNVVHPTYFPWGKNDDIYVDETDMSGIYEIVRRTLGLVHHNMYIDEAQYDEHGNMISARVRIYDDAANVGSNTGVIETYLITSDAEACGQFTFWQQAVI